MDKVGLHANVNISLSLSLPLSVSLPLYPLHYFFLVIFLACHAFLLSHFLWQTHCVNNEA